jgi:hypothetical protein
MNVMQTNDGANLVPAGGSQVGEELTVADSVVTPLTTFTAVVTHVLFSVKAQPVRVTWDGASPAVGGAGVYYAAGDREVWHIERFKAAKLIRYGGSSAAVRFEPLAEA